MSSKDPADAMFEFDSSVYRSNYALSGKLLLSAIVVLFFVILLLVCLHVYSQWYLLQVRRRRRRRRRYHTSLTRRRPTTQFVFYVDPSNPNAAARAGVLPRGLDAMVLKSLPLFIYTAETHPDPIECAVCLSEFEELETGRVLPKCKHSFHIECIDMWFHSHSTCPLCRNPVEAPVSENPVVEPSPSSVGSGTSGAGTRGAENGLAGGVASTSSFGESRKPSGETVTIEVPARRINSNFENESGSESPASQALRSPISHVLSFKRILTRDRRAAVSPPSSYGEPDIERRREETQ